MIIYIVSFSLFYITAQEFEIVAQIKLLQQSAKNYSLEANQKFCVWFNSLETYGDKEG